MELHERVALARKTTRTIMALEAVTAAEKKHLAETMSAVEREVAKPVQTVVLHSLLKEIEFEIGDIVAGF